MEHDSPPCSNAGGGADAEGAPRRAAKKKRDDVYWDANSAAFTVVSGDVLGIEHLHLEQEATLEYAYMILGGAPLPPEHMAKCGGF
jgi:hypothetical protein